MDSDPVGPLRHRERHRRDTPGKAFAGFPSAQSLDERFPRDADDDRMAEGDNPVQVLEEGEAVFLDLPKPHSWIHRDGVGGNTPGFQYMTLLRSIVTNFPRDLGVIGMRLHPF